jgi:cyclophilin family peptidyl-prolyl cis-trans isomerase
MKSAVSRYLLGKVFSLPLLLLGLWSFSSFATTVRMQTSLGYIDVQLLDAAAPATVVNFLSYVTAGAYDGSFVHRSVPGFIIQGGGYRWNSANNSVATIPANAPVVNEYSASRSNLRGTIAMAKLGSDPNSATNQWFFNLADNSTNLDSQNGGFTVFGRVIGDGMKVVDAIAALPIVNANGTNTSGPFGSLPLVTVPTSGITSQNLVMISAIVVLPELALASGWNLVGNGRDAQIDVATTFSDAGSFLTVWKWNATQGTWAFHAPSLAAQGGTVLADYAASKGYQSLTTIGGGEGFWINAKQAGSVAVSNGNAISIAALGPTLINGWNLVSAGEAATPKQFCDAQTSGVTTLWAWDTANSAWYFYAPSLDTSGGLASYITSKGYLDFTASSKTLAPGVGFWVNRP